MDKNKKYKIKMDAQAECKMQNMIVRRCKLKSKLSKAMRCSVFAVVEINVNATIEVITKHDGEEIQVKIKVTQSNAFAFLCFFCRDKCQRASHNSINHNSNNMQNMIVRRYKLKSMLSKVMHS